MRSITPQAFLEQQQANPSLRLIDVRTQAEHNHFNIGGPCIPLDEIFTTLDAFAPGEDVIIYCEKGIRSAIAIQRLEARIPAGHLINLSGGLQALKTYI